MKLIIIIYSLLVLSFANAQSYLVAKRAINQGADLQDYQHLSDTPLYPYLAYEHYRQRLSDTPALVQLFNQYYTAPPIKRLFNRWIKARYDNADYQSIIQHYLDTGSQQSECIYRAALLHSDQRKKALKNIKDLWLSSTSISDYCDPVFAAWGQAHNPKLVLKRSLMAYQAGNITLAGQLANRLSNTDREIIQQFIGLIRNPTQLLDHPKTNLTLTPLHQSLLPKALAALVRKDSVQYASFALSFNAVLKNQPQYQDTLDKLTVYLANRHDAQVKQTHALLKKPSPAANDALIRYLVMQKDWRGLTQKFSTDSENSMTLYWLGRAHEARGQQRAAKNAYRKAAKIRSYYGFLAADKIKQPYQFTEQAIKPNTTAQTNLEQNTNLIRARHLIQYNQTNDAKREIFSTARLMGKSHKRQLAYWLDRHGFHHEAIYTLGSLREWNDIRIRFPLPFNPEVSSANQRTGIDPTWIYAIIRQESTMNPLAKSSAKAMGLMQLIPGTARQMARDLGITLSSGAVYSPSINTQLGANYLKKMFNRFGSLVLASAAYNAGPARVERWLNDSETDMSIWVEKIPFNETRQYVKNILEYQQVYAKHLKFQLPTITTILNLRQTNN